MSTSAETIQWRRLHPEKWNAQKTRHYEKTRWGRNRYQRWTLADLARICAEGRPRDSVLAQLIGRGELAIQVQRCKLIKRGLR
jgi:hypothetical protein